MKVGKKEEVKEKKTRMGFRFNLSDVITLKP